jgi:hypothetical protein
MPVNLSILTPKNSIKTIHSKHHNQKTKMEVIPKVSREGKPPIFTLFFTLN